MWDFFSYRRICKKFFTFASKRSRILLVKVNTTGTEAYKHIGELKQRITVDVASFECKSSWSNMYGMTFLYKFTDTNGNVFVWYASNPVEYENRVETIVGTVKEHSEFNGVKQTVLTRCKVTYKPEQEERKLGTNKVKEALDMFFDYVNA